MGHETHIYAGLDLQINKMSSLVLVSDNAWKAYFWLPEKQLPKAKRKYRKWISQGLIRLTPGDVADYDIIIQDICTIRLENPFIDIAFDRWESPSLVQKLSNIGANVVGVSQGFMTFSPACDEYIHSKPTFENPVLKWMDRNLSFLTDPTGNKKPNRQRGEIGGIAAGLMAMSLASTHRSTKLQEEVYMNTGDITVKEYLGLNDRLRNEISELIKAKVVAFEAETGVRIDWLSATAKRDSTEIRTRVALELPKIQEGSR